ncbi:DNA repair protein RecO [Mycoplasma tauri]|uniref:DNA repair protein RecO n=1 Tax=Mycoplasma tauri TaxID=547987 RepID=UPI001CBFA9FF|nr:DNA repair protein RecO C-terminal domain-containing protein [Mycoplasma tauri]MBZ4203619.1 DNA repair protein RecO C-terminal domain-containing protein [Mycoplasma tauri]
MAEKEESVVILKIDNYLQKEYAAIVKALTKNGLLILYSPGIFKANSKNRQNLQIGSIVNLEYFKSTNVDKMSKLKKAVLQIQPNYSDKATLLFVSKMCDFLENFKQNSSEVFEAYKKILEYYDSYYVKLTKNINIDSYTFYNYAKTYLVSKFLKYNGIHPQIERCINCKSPSNLCDFSFKQGGYTCGGCTINQKWTKELKSIYYLFKNFETFCQIVTPEINNKIYNNIINHLIYNGIFINWEIIKKV